MVRDAALVIEGERVVAIEAPGPPPTSASTPRGRAVIPGFVDSHTHLVFAGDRSEEFAARMAGKPYEAGGSGSAPRPPGPPARGSSRS